MKFKIEVELDINISKEGLTREIMQGFLEHYQDLNELELLDAITSQVAKHHAMIALQYTLGEREHFEGYGHFEKLVKSADLKIKQIDEV